MSVKQFSKYQIAIFDKVKNSNENICVQATAGAGKTTTLLEILNLIPRFKKTVFLSFSNTIVNELKERIPSHTTASTIHSLGCRMVFAHFKGVKVNENKWFQIFLKALEEQNQGVQEKLDKKKMFKRCYEMQEIVNFARMTCTKFEKESLIEMCDYYSLEYSEEHFNTIIEEFNKPRKITEIDFTDMLYLPVKLNLITTVYDYVLLDEAQDLNNIQKILLEKIINPDGGRLIAVGDEKQSIYSFSGSNIDSFNQLQKRKNTVTLPLSISYRCGKNIVREAQKIYPTSIEYFENAIEGEVRDGSLSEIREDDIVISRKTAPLVTVFFSLLEKGVKAQIVGKDIEQGLVGLAEKVESSSIESVYERCDQELNLIEKELKERGISNPKFHNKYINTDEKISVIKAILNYTQRPNRLVSEIKHIFGENKRGVRLMTIHRSKGLESDRVFMINRYNGEIQCPSPKATKEWEKIQENNLLFVGITRAKKSLIMLNISEGREE